jgi:cellobiose phosphorylase
VPYPVEAYPEGNQRHLSAESALYCRVITEGLFGIRPEGLYSFSCAPQLPAEWEGMSLRNIQAFNRNFDIDVKKQGEKILVRVFNKDMIYLENEIMIGEHIRVDLK